MSGPLHTLEQWDDFVASRYDPNKKKDDFRNYETTTSGVREFYRLNHTLQTREFVLDKKRQYTPLTMRRMGVWEALEYLNTLVDDSDPDTDLSQIEHNLQTAEAIRRDGHPDWFVLTGLVHDLGKGTTPAGEWPRHLDHEQRGAELVRAFCQRLRIPTMYRELGVVTAHYHTHCHRALELRPKTLLNTLQGLDALRKPPRFEQFLIACEADARGRLGLEHRDYPQADFMRRIHRAAAGVQARPLLAQGLTGLALAEALRGERMAAIAEARLEFKAICCT